MLTGGLSFSRPLAVVWLVPAAFALVALVVTRRSRRGTRQRVVYTVQLLVLAYLVGCVLITLWPLEVDVSASRMLERGNWMPGRGTLAFVRSENELQARIGERDALANIVLFMPVGILMPLVIKRRTRMVVAGLFVASVAFGLELVQGLVIVGRTFDIDDAIVSLAGAVAALAAGLLLRTLTGPPR